MDHPLLMQNKGACKVCGTADHACKGESDQTPALKGRGVFFIENPFSEGTTPARASGVFATKHHVEDGRYLYRKGQEIRPQDLERLGYVSAKPRPKAESNKTSAPKPVSERARRGRRRGGGRSEAPEQQGDHDDE